MPQAFGYVADNYSQLAWTRASSDAKIGRKNLPGLPSEAPAIIYCPPNGSRRSN
jgi:hypothetical protein